MLKSKFVAFLGDLRATYKKNARVRGISWALSDLEFAELVSKPCHYCGALPRKHTPIKFGARRISKERLNGVDRLDPTLGYELSNCVPACKRCNQGKNDMTKPEFLSWAARVVEKARGK